ncbi:MAG: metal ABC transporter permease [Aureliella sp.]
MADWTWHLDGWIMAAGILCAISASLLGNFLVLRQMSMLGDAITHAILPGLAVAFLITESRSSLPMFIGAVIVGVLTALFTEWIRRFGRVDEGASMGVVFTSLFALGLVLIVQAADYVDLDASCVLFGSIEYTPLDTTNLFGLNIPRAVLVLGSTAAINAIFVIGLFKELKITSFDPSLATTTGFNSSAMHYALMVLVAVTSVAAFESVGNILVVAMFIVPPAAAYMVTDRLERMILLSVVFASLAAALGHVAAIEVPGWFGYRSTTTAGMMAAVAGAILLLAVVFSPKHGIASRYIRRLLLARRILSDDIVALLYRWEENGKQDKLGPNEIAKLLLTNSWTLGVAISKLVRGGDLAKQQELLTLTAQGRIRAQNLVRSHRLWESYLQDYAGVDPAKVHVPAEQLEHFTDSDLRQQLGRETESTSVDPHGKPIPEEASLNPSTSEDIRSEQ